MRSRRTAGSKGASTPSRRLSSTTTRVQPPSRRKAFSCSSAQIDDYGMRKLPLTAAEDLLEIIMRRYERVRTLLTSNRLVENWGKLLGDVAAVAAMLDRILHHGHVLKCGPRSWRTKAAAGGGQ